MKAGQSGSLIMGGGTSATSLARSIVVRSSMDEPPPPPPGAGTATGLPLHTALLHNYPNPFNPATTISFVLPEPAKVTLKVFNILGEEVATLAASTAFPRGRSGLVFDGSAVPSGVYVFRMATYGMADGRQEFTASDRMILLK